MDNVPHCKMIEDIAGVTELTLEEVFLKITTGDIYGNVADSVDKLNSSK